jgi:hypothetical protein
MLVHIITIWNILRPFGIIYSRLVLFCENLVIFSRFGMFGHEKSGNPAENARVCESIKKELKTNVRRVSRLTAPSGIPCSAQLNTVIRREHGWRRVRKGKAGANRRTDEQNALLH